MAEINYEQYFLREPFGHIMHGPGIKVPPGTPLDKPYWIGIGQEEPEPWGFPLSMVLRPIFAPRIMFAEGAHTHDVSEILYFIGGDPMNFDEFGAEAELILDGKKFIINKTTFVHVPPGMPHCPLEFTKVDKPVMFGHIMITDMYRLNETLH